MAGDRSGDHFGRWQDLPAEHLFESQWAIPHLDEQGVRYYFPAIMTLDLRHFPDGHPDDHWITESLGYSLQPSHGDLRGYQQSRLALLDRAQRATLYAYTLASRNDEAATAWARVFEAEHDGERGDWFELLSPR